MSGSATIPGPGGSTISFTVSGAVAAAVAQVFAADLAGLAAKNDLFVGEAKVVGGHIVLPPVPDHKVGLLVIPDSVTGAANLTLPANSPYEFVVNESGGGITINATADPNILSTSTGSTTVFGGTGAGSDVAAGGNNLFQALATRGGQYFVGFGNGNDTVWANSGNDVIGAGGGDNLIGLGSGNNFVVSEGADTILAGSGLDTVLAEAGSSALIFGSTGGLLFVGGGAGTSSTIIGGSGNETLFGGAGSGLFFVGSGSLLLTNQGGSDTVVAGAGAPTVSLFGGSGGSISLFSSTNGDLLVAGAGNETLNAAGTTGTTSLWAGAGSDSLVGGSGSDIFAFVKGQAHGVDTVGGWTAKDTLVLIGYGSGGIVNQSNVGGNALITLSDGTTISFTGVSNIPSSHISLT